MSYNSNHLSLALLTVLAGAVLTACNGLDVFEESVPDGKTVLISVTADENAGTADENAGTETRSCIDPTVYRDGVTGLMWSPRDSIGVFSADGTENARFVSNSDANVKNAVFAGTMGAVPEYAYFPYTSENDGLSPTKLKGSVGSVQKYNLGSKVLSYDWKYGSRKSDYSSEEGYRFAMKQLFSLG